MRFNAIRVDIQTTIYYACKSIVSEGTFPRLRVHDLQKMRLDEGYREEHAVRSRNLDENPEVCVLWTFW